MSKGFVKEWGMLPPLTIFFVFPLTFVLGKLGFQFGPQILFVGFRMLLSGAFLLLCYMMRPEKHPNFTRKDWLPFFNATFFGIGAYIPEFWALKFVSVAKVALIFLSVPFFSALFEHLHGISKITRQKLIGLVIGLCGMLPMVLSGHSTNDASFCFGITFPEFLIIVSAAGYSYGWISMKQLLVERKHSSVLINGARMTIGGFMAVLSSMLLEGWTDFAPPVSHWCPYLWYAVLISVVGVFCFSLYAFLLRYYSVTLIAFTGFTEPFFAALYAWILLGETVSWIFFVSLCIVAVGLYLFYKEELRLGT